MFGRSVSSSGGTSGGFSFGGGANQQQPSTGGSLFGNKPAAPAGNTGSGFSFGASQQQPQQNGGQTNQPQGGGLFGGQTTNTGGLFGNAQQNTSGGSSLFNNNNTQQNNTSGGLLGNSNNTSGGTGLFGGQQQNTGNSFNTAGGLFGANNNNNQQSQPSSGLFGNNNQTTANTSGGLFGQKPAGTTTGSNLFSNTNNNTSGLNTGNQFSSGGGLFGGGGTSSTGGGLFGQNQNRTATTGTGGGLFGGLQQQQQQQQPQNSLLQQPQQMQLPPLTSMTRVNELPEAMQNQLEEFDNYIQLQMSIRDNLISDESNHKELIESIPRDINFLEGKYVTVNQTLQNNLKFVEDFKTKELDLLNMWVEKLLKLYLQLTTSNGSANGNGSIGIQTLDPAVNASANSTLSQFFLSKIEDFERKIDSYKSILREIENTIDGLDKVSINGLDKNRGVILAYETLKDQFQLFMELSNNMAEIHHEVKKLTGKSSTATTAAGKNSLSSSKNKTSLFK